MKLPSVSLIFALSCLLSPAGIAQDASAASSTASNKIEILRDDWGVPHIFASRDDDALYALGYATARDRGFQMHHKLRIAQGRLAETVGLRRHTRRQRDTTLTSDRKMRTFGFHRAAKRVVGKLDPETRALLEAYSDGVNAWFEQNKNDWHHLFEKLGVQPEPWTPADCILTWWYLGQFFATDGTRDLLAYRNRNRDRFARGGAQMRRYRELEKNTKKLPPDQDAAVVQREDVSDEWLGRVTEYLRSNGFETKMKDEDGEPGPKFSHAWVVGGKRSTTGSTLLVSDPQTPVTNPSLFYEFHVSGKTFNARGIGIPGSPMLLIGFTEHVAWGVTALGADQADLFRLKTDAEHPGQYEFDGEWRDFETRTEIVKVRNGRNQELKIRETHLGPVVNEFAFATRKDGPVAVKRIPVCETDRETIQASIEMMRASNSSDFAKALPKWRFPSVNMLFGDKAGNIGYWVQAAIPLRSPTAPAIGRQALDGTSSKDGWLGIMPHDLLPHVINPKRGYIYSGNHMPVGDFYPGRIGISTGSQGHSLRSWRLAELLAKPGKLSPKDVFAAHKDCVNPARRELVRIGLHVTRKLKEALSPEAELALIYLEPWFDKGASSDLREEGAALAMKLPMMFRMTNSDLTFRYGGGLSGLSRWLGASKKRLLGNPSAKVSDLEVEYVDRVLGDAWLAASREYGDDPNQWRKHALEAVKRRRLAYFRSLDGFPALDPAKTEMVPGLFCVDGSTIQSQAAQSYTQLVDLSDVDSSMSILPPGQSERARGAERDRTMKLWEAAELHPAPLSRAAVLRLHPKRETLERSR